MKRLVIIFFIFFNFTAIFAGENIDYSKYSEMSLEQLNIELNKFSKENTGFIKYSALGVIYHFMAGHKGKTAGKSVENLSKALQIKNDPKLEILLGSAYTLMGDEAVNAGKKINYVNTGTAILDKVYNENKNDFFISVVYIENCLGLPEEIFHRTDKAVQVIEYLTTNFDRLNYEEKSILLYLKGMSLFKSNNEIEAIYLWEDVVNEYPDTVGAQKSEKMLIIYGE